MRDISFALDSADPTLLTGVNGTGKSTVLRTIDAIGTGRWNSLFSIPFRELVLQFESGIEIQAFQTAENLRLELLGENAEPWSFPRDSESWPLIVDTVRQQLVENASGSNAWHVSRPSTNWNTTYEFFPIEGSQIDVDTSPWLAKIADRGRYRERPEWVEGIPQRFPVLFITDQRLVIEPPQQGSGRRASAEAVATKFAAEEAAANIAEAIASAQANYASTSQSLDRDFPKRVIEAIARPRKTSEIELKRQLTLIARHARDLRHAALLPPDAEEEFADLNFSAAHTRAVIDTYVQDARAKLDVLEPLRRRLALFSEFLNQHYHSKYIEFDPQKGFVIRVEGRDDPLPPSNLSSGEQQILVLAHHILFRATPGTLVLIDEPELSLHVLWQSVLVDDLSEMGRERNLSFLLATHSPALIAGREDLRRPLDPKR
ncbi:AAA family ATPase [Micromonospora sp. D93]|uniref:AAA family ATPase n=1 Tax=Micromonospora sp. D93 TaxID=2824886 RepID=UPI001B35D6FC|nr:AAA family ATPase [Micromonospora sp. D93]MBQ1017991.1 AAA family ATPase [Micromonospora sp. D93]